MGRPERTIDPQAGPVQRFAWELRGLREKAGKPSYRRLSRIAHFSSTALSEAAGGDVLPSLAVTLAYVTACDGDPEEWEQRWREVAAKVQPSRQVDGPAPYPGLAAFQPEDAERFHGREALVAELVERLERHQVLGVFGPSGCGKSSLLRAGLVPALPWRTVLLTPTAHPVRELARRLADAGDVELVVVDQFEELFTLVADQEERRAFIVALLGLTARVVFAARADFLGHCAAVPELVEALRDAQVLVGPMTGDELRRVIELPAAHAGLTVEPDLVAAALTDVYAQPGALPLLSHALLETWRGRENDELTLARYRACGGVTGAIAATAERTYGELTARGRMVARGVLLRLVHNVDGGDDLRRRAMLSEVLASGDPVETRAVVDALAAARLVVVAEGAVELAHEALIHAWPRLREWIDEDREGLRVHRDLTAAARAWESLDRDPSVLYRGARLAVAQTLLGRDDWLVLSTPVEREFLEASGEQEATERTTAWHQARRMRRLAQALGVLLIVCVVVASVAVAQRGKAVHEQRVAQSRQLALRAQDLSGAWPDTAKRLAVEAYRMAPTTEARGTLLSTAAYKPPRVLFSDHRGPVRTVAFNADSTQLASAGDDRTVLLRHPFDGTPPVALTRHEATVRTLAFQPGRPVLASAGDDARIIVWDLRSRAPDRILPIPHGRLSSLAFSADGRVLASTSQDGTVILWDTTRWTELARVSHDLGEVNGVALSGDGDRVALAGQTGALVYDRATATGQVFHDHDSVVRSVALSPAGMLATGGDDSQIVLRDLPAGTPPAHLRRHISAVTALAFAPDGSMLLSAGEDGTARWWSVPSGGWLTGLITRAPSFHTAALSPDGRHLAAGGDENVSLWPVAVPPFTGHAIPPTAAAYSPDGHLATAGPDRLVIIWNRDGTPHDLLTTPAPVTALAFHRDGTLITADTDGAVTAWQDTAHRPRTITRHRTEITDLAVTRTGSLGATAATDGTIQLWDPSARGPSRELPGTPGTTTESLAFSPDGNTLAAAGDDGRVTLWDVLHDRQQATLGDRSTAVKTITFTPDGHTIATGDTSGTITLWHLDQHNHTTILPVQHGAIRDLAINADGTLLASAGSDNLINLWNPTTGAHVATLTGHTGPANAVAFGPPGADLLASTGADPRIIAWNLNPDTVINHICTDPHTHCHSS